MSEDEKGCIKMITEKYCPVVGHNVAVEATQYSYENKGRCLSAELCRKEHGGCTNKLL